MVKFLYFYIACDLLNSSVVDIAVRLSEALYSVKDTGDGGLRMEWNRLFRVRDNEKSCVPAGLHEDSKLAKITQPAHPQLSGKKFGTNRDLVLFGHSIYVDSDISDDVKRKVNFEISKQHFTIFIKMCMYESAVKY